MSRTDRQETDSTVLQEISESLKELMTWTRATGYSYVKQRLEAVLDSNEKRLVYDAMDGARSVEEIQGLTGVNARYISEWGQEWERIGIATPSRVSSVRGRRQQAFDLADFGIEVEGTANHRGERGEK